MARNIYGSLRRLKNFPIDPSSRFATYSEAELYCQNDPTAYVGQILGVFDDNNKTEANKNNNGVYLIASTRNNGKILVKASDSDKIIELEQNLQNLETGLTDLEERLGDDIEERLKSFATEDDLEYVDSRIDELIGLDGSQTIEKTLDTIKEISDWIVEHRTLVEYIVATTNNRLNDISNRTRDLEANVSDILNSDFASKSEVREMIENSSSGYKELSFANLTANSFTLPNKNIKLENVSIFLENGASNQDYIFEFYVYDPVRKIRTVYVSNEDETEANFFDSENLGKYQFYIGDTITTGNIIGFEIVNTPTYDPYGERFKGTIGISFYTLL